MASRYEASQKTQGAVMKRISAVVLFLIGFHSVGFGLGRGMSLLATLPKKVPAPSDVIGFVPGDDRKLAWWEDFVKYFKRLDEASDRVALYELGKTTLGRPFLLAIISSPQNLSRLERFKQIQQRLSDPRHLGDAEAEKLIAEGRTIVLITCGIHSTEVGANLVSMNLAYRLASDNSADVRAILENCIILLVPSLNPDGIDIVKRWYDETLNTPFEGTSPPELYHHYTGHDNNRDWYAFTQVETKLVVDKIYNVWHPQIVHDIHQQGEYGTRFFVPPYLDPWEPNVPPLIQAGANFLGTAMAWEMMAEGKSGIAYNAIYDAWTPARAYQHYHGGIRILSETASARLASPVSIPFERLNRQANVDPKSRSWNFPAVWPGGEWKLSDIVDYMQSGAMALLRNAARSRERWVRNFYLIGKEAVREHRPGQTFAFLILPPGDDIWRAQSLARLEAILNRGGVEIFRARSEFEAGGKRYPANTRIILMRQPYGAFAKALLERQRYPDLRQYPGGPPIPPYDVTAHTLSLLVGATAIELKEPFQMPPTDRVKTTDADVLIPPFPPARAAIYKSHAPAMDEGWTRWVFDQLKLQYASLSDEEIKAGNLRAKYQCIIFPDQSADQILNGLPANRYPARVAGGLGPDGVKSLREFLNEGGTIITLNRASDFAIEHLGAPVRNALKGLPASQFYCPGSILKIKLDPEDPLSRFVTRFDSEPDATIAWFESGPAFEPTGPGARIIARFARRGEVLLSGWLLGEEKIAGLGAIAEASVGRGRIIMFAFRPQYRGQSWATVPLLLNAIFSNPNR